VTELTCLKLSLIMWLAHIVAQAAFAGGAMGLEYLSSPRDEKREGRGQLYGRATRALHNYTENFLPFVAADLGLIATGHTGGWGATIWILTRIIYLPLYLAGVSPGRSIAWALSLLGLIMMIWRLL
jgi:uncharacterized MAPEG superfamily protein